MIREIDALKETYAALNRNDIEAAVKPFDPEFDVILKVHVRLKAETGWRDGRHAAVYTFRGGSAVEMRIFDDIPKAYEWAGLEAPEARPPGTS